MGIELGIPGPQSDADTLCHSIYMIYLHNHIILDDGRWDLENFSECPNITSNSLRSTHHTHHTNELKSIM